MKFLSLIILVIVATFGQAAAQNYKVIVNSSNAASSISKDEASDFFLKKKSKWSSGVKVNPVDQKAKSTVRVTFSSEVVGKPVSAVKSYWQQALFSGKGVPPPIKATDAEVIQYVSSNAGAIGYVSSSANTSGVKVLKVN